MYQVTVKGRTIEELKDAVGNVHAELNGQKVVNGLTRNLDLVHHVGGAEEELEDVPSPYVDQPLADDEKTARDEEVDSEGIPWLESIHAASRGKNKDGTWREKRSVTDEQIAKVKSQYLKTLPPQADPVLVPEFAKHIPVIVENPVSATQPTTTINTNIPTVLPPMPTMSAGHTLDTFKAKFVEVLAALITEKKITQEYVNQLKTYFSITEIWQANDDQKALCFQQWCDLGFIQKVG